MKFLPHILVALLGTAILVVQLIARQDLQEDLRRVEEGWEAGPALRSRSKMSSGATQVKHEEMMEKLEGYLMSGKRSKHSSGLNEMIDIVAEATADDLQAVIEELERFDPQTSEIEAEYYFTILHLKTLRDELDPMVGLRLENRREAFEVLVRRSPEQALEWFESANLSSQDRETFWNAYQWRMFSRDPLKEPGDWEMFREMPMESGRFFFDSTMITELVSAVNNPEHEKIREDLISTIIYSSLMEGDGLARSRADTMELTLEELLPVLSTLEDYGSRETLEWAIDLGGESPEKALGLQDVFLSKFAQQDLAGAAEWLNNFEGALVVRDKLTERYAMVLSCVDPESALEWCAQVQDEERREWVTRNTLVTWEIEDPKGYAEWKARQ